MPLFEDETLEGAIAKAVRAGRRRVETFGNRSYGSQIGGTGQSGAQSLEAALNHAGRAMEAAATQTYPRRSARVSSGATADLYMMPELSATIEWSEGASVGDDGPFDVSDLYVGRLIFEPGSPVRGEAPLNFTPRTAAVIHAHWLDTNPRTEDLTAASRALSMASERDYAARPQFWIYKWNGVKRPYS